MRGGLVLVVGIACVPTGGESTEPSSPSSASVDEADPRVPPSNRASASRICVIDGDGNPVMAASVAAISSWRGPPGSVYGWESAQMESSISPAVPTGVDGCAELSTYFAASRARVEVGRARYECGYPRGNQRLRLHDGACTLDPPWVPEMQSRSSFLEVAPPFAAGTSTFVHQGPLGPTHRERGIGFAWDLDVPEGTPVLAIAVGTVIGVFAPGEGGGCEQRYADVAHNVQVEHEDGTVAQYVHVESTVRVGERVIVGQPIAKTAINGFICTPHLHLGVYASRDQMFDSRNPRSLPLWFSRLGALQEGDRVTVPSATSATDGEAEDQ